MSGPADEEQLTRKQRREHARAERKALEQAAAASAARRTRLTQLGIVGAIVVAAIVAIVVATGGGAKKGLVANKKAANQTVAALAAATRVRWVRLLRATACRALPGRRWGTASVCSVIASRNSCSTTKARSTTSSSGPSRASIGLRRLEP